jgi:hypothetical protein
MFCLLLDFLQAQLHFVLFGRSFVIREFLSASALERSRGLLSTGGSVIQQLLEVASDCLKGAVVEAQFGVGNREIESHELDFIDQFGYMI